MNPFRWALFSILILGISSATAQAYNLNLFGGSNIRAGEEGLAALELTLPVVAEVGPFFEWNHTTDQDSDNRYLTGLMGRITTPWLNFFIDTRAGYYWNNGFNLELGMGYRFVGDTFDLMPRLGINAVTTGGNMPDFNLSVGIALVL